MKNKSHRIVTIALLVALGGCSSTSGKESTGEYIDDSVITIRVKSAVFQDPNLKSAEINVETFKGVVQLSGFVKTENDIRKAVDLAQAVSGVTAVTNGMKVKGEQ